MRSASGRGHPGPRIPTALQWATPCSPTWQTPPHRPTTPVRPDGHPCLPAASRPFGMTPARARNQRHQAATFIEGHGPGRRDEHERSRHEHAGVRPWGARRDLLLQLLPIRRALGGRHVPRRLDERPERGIGHWVLVHPEPIHPNAMRGSLVRHAAGIMRAHGEFAARNPAHAIRCLARGGSCCNEAGLAVCRSARGSWPNGSSVWHQALPAARASATAATRPVRVQILCLPHRLRPWRRNDLPERLSCYCADFRTGSRLASYPVSAKSR